MKTQEPAAIDEQAVFLEGVKHGHILYRQVHQGKPLTPRAVYDFLMTVLLDTTHQSVWNAGYISGWYLAKYQAEDATAMQQVQNDLCLQWPSAAREE